MACNGVLIPPSKSNSSKLVPPPPVLKFFNLPQSSNFLLPLQLEIVASAFFTHGYFQQAHVHISEAIMTD